jgi:hypothetical protein
MNAGSNAIAALLRSGVATQPVMFRGSSRGSVSLKTARKNRRSRFIQRISSANAAADRVQKNRGASPSLTVFSLSF